MRTPYLRQNPDFPFIPHAHKPVVSRALFHFVELAVLVAGIGVVLAYIVVFGAPLK